MGESSASDIRELTHDLAELIVHINLTDLITGNTMPEAVQEQWEERITYYKEWVGQQIEELQQFGEAFDA